MSKFKPGNQFGGQSPGRPKGTRDRFSARCDEAAQGAGLRVLQAALEAAINGDSAAQRIVLDRLWPRPNGVFVRARLPFLANASDVESASAAVIDDLANGRLRTDEAEALHAALRRHVEILSGLELGLHLDEMAARLKALEMKSSWEELLCDGET